MTTDAKKPLVIIIDEDRDALNALGKMLEKNGCAWSAAPHGTQTDSFLEAHLPDLAVLRLAGAESNGLEICRRIKANPLLQDIPVLFSIARREEPNVSRLFDAGGADYIVRPYIEKEVAARVLGRLQLKTALDRLDRMAVTDELTGLFNRKFAFRILDRQIDIARREQENFVLCYIDIDNLNQINKAFGHDSGDEMIVNLADTLRRNTRKADYVCRISGDDFLLVFPKIRLEEADTLIERLWEKLNQEKFNNQYIDFSYGFAEFRNDDALSADDLIRIANANMTEAKKEKRTLPPLTA